MREVQGHADEHTVRAIDVTGQLRDRGPDLPSGTPYRPIHNAPPALKADRVNDWIFETGIKVIGLPPEALLAALTANYMHAALCQAALHSFAAENEARMAAMAAAHRHIDQQLQTLELTRRIVRQEEITAEIIELAAAQTANGTPSPG